jgi:hypothetical protein
MAQMPNDKLDAITDEVNQLHPLLGSVLPKLPRVVDVEYTHGTGELGADFVIHRTEEVFGGPEYIGVIGKVGKIAQDLTAIERQIEECDLPRLFRAGKEKIRITEIWVVATKHVTRNAEEKIHEKYRNRKIVFIDGTRLEKLVDKYAPLAWSGLPIAIVEYLQDLRVRYDGSLLKLVDNKVPAQVRERCAECEYLVLIKGSLPVDLQLALEHEGGKLKERSALMRKQDRQLRRVLPSGLAFKNFVRDLYERPVNAVIERVQKTQERKEKRNETMRLPSADGRPRR